MLRRDHAGCPRTGSGRKRESWRRLLHPCRARPFPLVVFSTTRSKVRLTSGDVRWLTFWSGRRGGAPDERIELMSRESIRLLRRLAAHIEVMLILLHADAFATFDSATQSPEAALFAQLGSFLGVPPATALRDARVEALQQLRAVHEVNVMRIANATEKEIPADALTHSEFGSVSPPSDALCKRAS